MAWRLSTKARRVLLTRYASDSSGRTHTTRRLLDEPYTQRRRALAGLKLDEEAGGVVKTPPYWADDAGKDLLDAAAEQGLEGVVAKRLDSPYQPGARSRYWIKTPLIKTVEVVIAGWKPGDGRRAGIVGSLVLGMYDDEGKLVFVGGVMVLPDIVQRCRSTRSARRLLHRFEALLGRSVTSGGADGGSRAGSALSRWRALAGCSWRLR